MPLIALAGVSGTAADAATGQPLTLTASAKAVVGDEKLTVKGRTPAAGRVWIEQRLDGAWRVVARLRAPHRRFHGTVRVRGETGATHRLRAHLPRTASAAAGRRRRSAGRDYYSRALTVRKEAPPPQLHPQWRGVDASANWQWTDQASAERDVAEAAGLGADTIRIGLRWSWLEPNKAGVYPDDRVQRVDRLLQVADANGLRVVATALGTPCWASTLPGAPTSCLLSEYQNHPPRNAADFGRFISFVASRWGAQLDGLEVWNEPNLSEYWTGTAAQYMELVREAFNAVQSVRPELPVVAGAVALADTAYLDALYSHGIAESSDAISFHPYDWSGPGFANPVNPDSAFATGVRAMHNLMLAHGDSDPLWLTEFGYASCPSVSACDAPEQQAAYAAASLYQAATFDYVEVVLMFRLRDWYPSGKNLGYGLLNEDFSPKLAFEAVQNALSLLPRVG